MSDRTGGADVPRRPRVLIVEDDDTVRASLLELMEAAGVEVVGAAGDGDQGVRLAVETRPDVVLMDLRMRRMGGVEATAAIKAAAPGVHVVVLTAYEDPWVRGEAERAGASAYVVKGTATATLLDTVRRLARDAGGATA